MTETSKGGAGATYDLRAQAVTWSVGRRPRRRVLDRVDLDAPSGSVTGLLGPNGSGKTSLLHLLAGLRRPDAGAVFLGDHDVHDMGSHARARRLALVEQHTDTGLDLSVRQVVELGRTPHRGRFAMPAGDEPMIADAMRFTGVETFADRSWTTLSGGERQRVHLARAIAQQPSVLLLDEPTNHLDLGHQLDFLERVRALGLTTVAALHDLDLAAAYCDYLVVLDRGRVAAAGTVAEVITPAVIRDVYGVTVDVTTLEGRTRVRWRGTR